MNEQKKILYVVTKSSWGGAQRYLFDLAQHFSRTHNVLVGFGKNEFGSENIFKQKLDNENIKNTEIKYLGRNISIFGDVLVFFSLLLLFKKERPDIVHLNSSKIGALGALAGRLLGIRKIVYTTHGLPFFEDRPKWQNMIIQAITKLTCALSHQVISVAQYEQDFIEKNWPRISDKTTRIYNAIHPIDFISQESARAEVLGGADKDTKQFIKSHNPLILGSIGELTNNKGYSYLLDSLAQLKEQNVPVVFSHYGTGVLDQSLKTKTESLGLSDRVIWNGFSKQAPTLLKGFDVFVLPSLKEGLGYVLLEAGQAGLPLIGSRVGGIPEVIVDEQSGLLVEPKDGTGLTGVIKQLTDPHARESFGAGAAKHTQETFSINTMLRQTESVYN